MKIIENEIYIDDKNVKSVSINTDQVGDVKKQEIFIIMADENISINLRKSHKDAE